MGIKDLLPQPPWEGPPIPRPVKSNGGVDPFDHWMKTGKYIFKGIEYAHVPYKLEVDTSRGVIYLHSLMTGDTRLRVCRVHEDYTKIFEQGTGTVSIHLESSPVRNILHTGGKVITKEPVFLELGENSFTICDETGTVLLEFRQVPERLIQDLFTGTFTDITMGHTGR